MSPQQVVTWSDAAQKFILPMMLAMVTLVGGWGVSELTSMRFEIRQLQVRVAEMSVELRMHREVKIGG